MSQSKHHDEMAIKLTGVSKKYEIHHETCPPLAETDVGRKICERKNSLKY